jgi:hypothetical protein
MTDPSDALPSFQEALRTGEISLQATKSDPDLGIYFDRPNDSMRMTYAYVQQGVVVAIAMIVQQDFEEGRPCFHLGYAVHEGHRREGWGKRIASASVADFLPGMKRAGVAAFQVEAVVGLDNPASQRIAGEVISKNPREITDSVSGLPALHYSMVVG